MFFYTVWTKSHYKMLNSVIAIVLISHTPARSSSGVYFLLSLPSFPSVVPFRRSLPSYLLPRMSFSGRLP